MKVEEKSKLKAKIVADILHLEEEIIRLEEANKPISNIGLYSLSAGSKYK